jgi:DNA-binding response OmpR family regulator
MKAKILLVEDDINLGDVLRDYLELQDYEVVKALNGEEGLDVFNSQHFDLLLLDVMLPLKDGFTLATEIRELNREVPIIFLTARSQMQDRVTGFKAGCDDYLTKPFSSEELELRIEAILRRCQKQDSVAENGNLEPSRVFPLGNYTFDSGNQELRIGEKRIGLTTKEVELLRILYNNKNQLVTRETALKTVWGINDYFIGRSMDVFITKLRKYLKLDPNISIVNVHGTGFRLEVKE